MDIGDLKVFEAVARLGGMNRAAAELNTVQSNVTARIRALEEELGGALFERHARGVTLTAAGQRLMPYALRARQVLEEARRAFRDDGHPRGALTIGSLETTAALRLSARLSDFVGAHPDVDLVLRTGTTCELIQEVLEHRLEGAFVCGPVGHPELEERLAFREDLALLTHPAIRDPREVFAARSAKIVVLRAGCSYRQRLEELLARRGVGEVRMLEFGTIEAILGCVAAGIGITLLPRSLVRGAEREGHIAVHDLPAREGRVDTLFIRRRDGFASSALRAFVETACAGPREVQAAE
ncbi:LysR substrate-binding domain-containing protein [Roseococcus sp. YIM B11640]|uniref:LysR family transcriptional regulator n=1 Tax=Roseococcus sp. YIM B11640 TaxID=3133973 RepID=UPI003C7D3085